MAFITSPSSILFIALSIVIAAAAFAWMAAQDQTYAGSAPYAPRRIPNPDVAVIYYSRSGHTEAVARYVARHFNAPIARIDADYPLSLAGQRQAVEDANTEILPRITVEKIDLDGVHRVILVSPTWMFRPATPLWAYVAQTDLRNMSVVLIMTGNSRFKQEQIDAFAKAIDARGGQMDRHIFLRRGRFFWQTSRTALLQEVNEKLRRPVSRLHAERAEGTRHE